MYEVPTQVFFIKPLREVSKISPKYIKNKTIHK